MTTHDIVMRDLSELSPYENNARTHSDDQIAQLVGSIQEYGFTNPILIDETNTIIAGHGRFEAAELAGINAVPCVVISHLTESQKRAYIIADNKLALNAGWDEQKLWDELKSIGEFDFDLSLTGFSEKEISSLAQLDFDNEKADIVPENVESRSKPGDVWRLGNHRLMCGSSTNATDVEKLLGGVQPHLMVTDPPYGVEYNANWRNQASRSDGTPIGGKAIGKVENDDKADWREAWALFPGDVAYIWHAGNKAHIVAESLEATDFEIRSQIIWSKNNHVIGRGHYHPKHEPCWYAVRKNRTASWEGDRKQNTIWEIDKPKKSETGHSTQKPVECMRRPITNNSSIGQAIYEPFSGSGTTIIACEITSRHCYAMELSPEYVDLAVARWEEYTGQSASLA